MGDTYYMKRALKLAAMGEGYTNPNPMVGSVVVKDGRIIAEGYHEKIGGYHAERNALMNLGEEAAGADLYVTLEPCCHYGKTPPCTDIIIEKKIARVFIGSMDPNPLVCGGGVKILRDAGIEVKTGVLEDECLRLNEVFFHYITTGLPYIVMKYAMSLDGKIACRTGDSRWVTGEEARRHVHSLRKKYAAIMVGINTVVEDDPMLNCRTESGADPLRVICDSKLRIPMDSNIVRTSEDIPTVIACSEDMMDEDRRAKALLLEERGIKIIGTSPAGEKDKVNIPQLLRSLGDEGIDSILLEGGASLNWSFVEQGLVDKVVAYVAPKLIGGAKAKSPVTGEGFAEMREALRLDEVDSCRIGDDLLITGYPSKG